MPPLPPAIEVAARTRAALGYAGIKLTERGKKVNIGNISHATISRIVAQESPRGVTTIEELHEIADHCRIPRAFMEHGFAPLERPISDVEGRVYELERLLEQRLADVEIGIAILGQAASEAVQRQLSPLVDRTAVDAAAPLLAEVARGIQRARASTKAARSGLGLPPGSAEGGAG